MNGFVIGDRGMRLAGDTHPAWMAGHAVAGPYLLVGASAAGAIHLFRRLPRDDAFVVRRSGSWVAVAVADGVGSRPLSRYGASYVTEALTSLLLQPYAPPLKGGLAEPNTPRGQPLPSVAPPAVVEGSRFRISICKSVGAQVSLLAGLQHWLQQTFRPADTEVVEEVALDEVNPPSMRQAASLGWWLEEDNPDPVVPASAPATDSATNSPANPIGEPGIGTAEPDRLRVMREAFENTHRGLADHAHILGVELRDLGCTALGLLLNLETGRGAVGQIGDGAMLCLTARGKARYLVEAPDTGDPQATYTVSRPDFDRYLAIAAIEPVESDPAVAFFTMTDGLSGDLLYSSEAGVLEKWMVAIRRNLHQSPSVSQASSGMLHWLSTYQATGSWDDRTLVVISRMEENHGDSDPAAGGTKRAGAVGDRRPAGTPGG